MGLSSLNLRLNSDVDLDRFTFLSEQLEHNAANIRKSINGNSLELPVSIYAVKAFGNRGFSYNLRNCCKLILKVTSWGSRQLLDLVWQKIFFSSSFTKIDVWVSHAEYLSQISSPSLFIFYVLLTYRLMLAWIPTVFDYRDLDYRPNWPRGNGGRRNWLEYFS